jgi:uncharacterized membrane protein YbaN (DUF454 family)
MDGRHAEVRRAKRTACACAAGWTAAGALMVLLGIIGAMLPVMPTTIFLILALACFSRASPRLEHWLLHHPRFGAPLRQWREHRAVSRRGKAMACLGMAIGFIAMCLGIRRGGSSSWWAAWNWPSSSTCCAARKARKAGQNLPPIAEITGSKRPLPRQENPN